MDIPTHAELVERINAFLARHDMAPSRLGRDATGEPDLVRSIRAGRSPSLDTLNKLAAYMSEHEAKIAADAGVPSANIGGEIIASRSEAPRHPFSSTSSPIPDQTMPSGTIPASPSSSGADAEAAAA